MLSEMDFTNLRDLIHFHESLTPPTRPASPAGVPVVPQTPACPEPRGKENTSARPGPLRKHARCEECCRSRRKHGGKKCQTTATKEKPQVSLSRRNIRERSRMSSFNHSFRRLQERVPVINKAPKRVPKEQILRSAISYIQSLQTILATPPESAEVHTDIAEHIFGAQSAGTTGVSDCSVPASVSDSLMFDDSACEALSSILSEAFLNGQCGKQISTDSPLNSLSTIVVKPEGLHCPLTDKQEVKSEPEEDFLDDFDSFLQANFDQTSKMERDVIDELECRLSPPRYHSDQPSQDGSTLVFANFKAWFDSPTLDESTLEYNDFRPNSTSSYINAVDNGQTYQDLQSDSNDSGYHGDSDLNDESVYIGAISDFSIDVSALLEDGDSPMTADDVTRGALLCPDTDPWMGAVLEV